MISDGYYIILATIWLVLSPFAGIYSVEFYRWTIELQSSRSKILVGIGLGCCLAAVIGAGLISLILVL